MSTRNLIAVYDKDNNNYLVAYCHWNGHPLDNGQELLSSYNDYEKAMELVKGGDMSTLGDYFDDSIDVAVIDDIGDVIQQTIKENKKCPCIEYIYLFVDTTWVCWDWHWSPDMAVLSSVEDVIREYKENNRG